jgi:hypothetical protein
MTVDKTLPGCTCPPGPDAVHVGCPAHFGDGWGNCITHEVDSNELRAAIGVCCDIGLCASCMKAHASAMIRHAKPPLGTHVGAAAN